MEGEDEIEDIQELLDAGLSRNKVASTLGLHHKTVGRLVEKYNLELYKAFDEEEDKKHLYQNFEWLWEEDWLEDNLIRKSFESTAILRRSENADVLSVGMYVRDTYGDLKTFFINKGLKRLMKNVVIECTHCGEFSSLRGWYRDERRLWGLIRECPECRRGFSLNYYENNPEKLFVNAQKRRTLAELLPNEFTKDDWIYVRSSFVWRCGVSRKVNSISLDHFVPINLGHGGTYVGNLVPMCRSLNSSKKDKNPFIWGAKNGHSLVGIVRYLSEQNNLTNKEYTDFVTWCFENPRNEDEVLADQRYSIEIWREATGRHFPLPKYALSEIGSRSTNETTTAIVEGKEAN
jgi:hypothetical protein